ncbi:MAG: hypothetical protein GXO63_00175 [Candidatus Micrarchaeota archaeon]|nr:hypothetical protein [Candidatus Micrarchaeota archaeon]
MCEKCGYYYPLTDHCVLRKLESEEKSLFHNYDGSFECASEVCSVEEIKENLKKCLSEKDYTGMLTELELLAEIFRHHGHKDLKDLANELHGEILGLLGYDCWTGEFDPHLNRKSKQERKILQKCENLLINLSSYF